MSEHYATIDWKRETPDFAYESYNRDHDWPFDSGDHRPGFGRPRLPGQRVVRRSRGGFRRQPLQLPHADLPGPRRQEAVHLWTATATRRSGCWTRTPRASGHDEGHAAPRSHVRRREAAHPGGTPSASRRAHHACFIANSVKTEVVVEPQ